MITVNNNNNNNNKLYKNHLQIQKTRISKTI